MNIEKEIDFTHVCIIIDYRDIPAEIVDQTTVNRHLLYSLIV